MSSEATPVEKPYREGPQREDAIVGELCPRQVQGPELGQAGQEQRGLVSDARVLPQAQVLQGLQPDQLLDALVSDAVPAALQLLQLPEGPAHGW